MTDPFPKKVHIFARLARIDRMCSKCRMRRPIQGGKVYRTATKQVFVCSVCRGEP